MHVVLTNKLYWQGILVRMPTLPLTQYLSTWSLKLKSPKKNGFSIKRAGFLSQVLARADPYSYQYTLKLSVVNQERGYAEPNRALHYSADAVLGSTSHRHRAVCIRIDSLRLVLSSSRPSLVHLRIVTLFHRGSSSLSTCVEKRNGSITSGNASNNLTPFTRGKCATLCK